MAVESSKRGDRAVVAAATVQDVGVLNVAGSIINPATEDKQDSAITALTSLDATASSTQITRGGETVSSVYDIDQHEIQKQILTQLKIMNSHFAEWHGDVITEQDV